MGGASQRGADPAPEETDTVATAHGAPAAHSDVTSDPANDARVGSDWSAEGGAVPSGPATDTRD